MLPVDRNSGDGTHGYRRVSRDGEPGQNYLCPSLELFFMHTGPTFNVMAQLLRQGHAPADAMESIAALDAQRGPYQPCPCGSGKKFRFCHGDRAPASPFSGVAPPTAEPRENHATPAQGGHDASNVGS